MKTKLIEWVRKFTEETHAKGYVVNISGGKDSTVVAALLVEAIGADKVFGILQPNGEQKDISDSIKVCDFLDIDYCIINIEDQYKLSIFPESKSLVKQVYRTSRPISQIVRQPIFTNEKTKTNIPPRIRMKNARTIAQSMGYRFAGTGNLSERYIGWFTKDGDSACDFNVIAGLVCRQVIKLGDELDIPYDLVHKTPADGLTGKSDEDNFGFTYDQLDDYILKGTSGDTEVDKLIKEKHVQSLHKNGVYTPAMSMMETSFNSNSDIYSITPWFNEDGSFDLGDNLNEENCLIKPENGFYTTFVSNLYR